MSGFIFGAQFVAGVLAVLVAIAGGAVAFAVAVKVMTELVAAVEECWVVACEAWAGPGTAHDADSPD